MATTKKKNYTLRDVTDMLWDMEYGTKTGSVDANADGKKDSSDVGTMMKNIAGWSDEAAKDPYRGKEVTPSGYADKQAYLLGKVTDRQPFSFSGGGELYDAYAKAYKREGDLAAKDTLSKVSARTGGVPSSYAVTATAAQQNQYAAALADKIPELYGMELEKYYSDAAQDRADLSALMGVKSQDLSEAYAAAEAGDYSYLERLGIDTTGLRDDAALERAITQAQYGDYSGLQAMGIDVSKILREQELSEAYAAAEMGDYSKLQALGIDTTQALRNIQLQEAYAAAEMGDFSKLAALGVDISRLLKEQEDADAAAALSNEYTKAQLANLRTENETSSKNINSIAALEKLYLGVNYWDDEVKEYAMSEYGLEPIDLYYAFRATDSDGYSTGVTLYDVVVEQLTKKGLDVPVAPISQWNGGNYEEYLRGIIKKYL